MAPKDSNLLSFTPFQVMEPFLVDTGNFTVCLATASRNNSLGGDPAADSPTATLLRLNPPCKT